MRIGELLISEGLIDPSQLDEALELQRISGGRLGTNLVEVGAISLATLGRALAHQHGVSEATAQDFLSVDPQLFEKVAPELCAKHRVFPLRLIAGKVLHVAMVQPSNLAQLDALSFAVGLKIQPCVAPELRMAYFLEQRCGVPRDARFTRLFAEEEAAVRLALAPGDGREEHIQPPRWAPIVPKETLTLGSPEIPSPRRPTGPIPLDELPLPAPAPSHLRTALDTEHARFDRETASGIEDSPWSTTRRGPLPSAVDAREADESQPTAVRVPEEEHGQAATAREIDESQPTAVRGPEEEHDPAATAREIDESQPTAVREPREPAGDDGLACLDDVRASVAPAEHPRHPMLEPSEAPREHVPPSRESTPSGLRRPSTPDLPALPPTESADDSALSSFEAVCSGLDRAEDAPTVARLLVLGSPPRASLSVIFDLQGQMAQALAAYGTPLSPAEVRGLTLPISSSYLLTQAHAHAEAVWGTAARDPLLQVISGYLRAPAPEEACVVPISRGKRVVQLLCVQMPMGEHLSKPIFDELVRLGRKATETYDRLLGG